MRVTTVIDIPSLVSVVLAVRNLPSEADTVCNFAAVLALVCTFIVTADLQVFCHYLRFFCHRIAKI